MSARCITADLLATKGAHCAQLDEFKARFPDGLDVETVRPKEIAGLHVSWMVHALLPAAAWEAYLEATAPALKAFVEARAPTREAHEEAEATVPAWEAFVEATAPAWETYREAIARAAIAVLREHWQEEEE